MMRLKFNPDTPWQLLLCLLGLLVLPLTLRAGNPKRDLWLDPSTDGNAVGYNIYYGTSSHIYTRTRSPLAMSPPLRSADWLKE